MSLHLFEVAVGDKSDTEVSEALASAEAALSARGFVLVEAQATGDRARLYLVIDGAEESEAETLLKSFGLAPSVRKQVRLVGQDLETARARRRSANFLVEWTFPPILPWKLTSSARRRRRRSTRRSPR